MNAILEKQPGLEATSHRFTLNIIVDDGKGIIGKILQLIYRSDHDLKNIYVAETDVKDMMIINIDIIIDAKKIATLARKIERIIEIHKVFYFQEAAEEVRVIGHFRLSVDIINQGYNTFFQKHGLTIIDFDNQSVTLEIIGRKSDVLNIYQELDGPYLLNFCSSSINTHRNLDQIDINLFSDKIN